MSDLIDATGLDFGGAPKPSTAVKAGAKPAETEIAIVQPRVLVPEQVFAPGALATLLDDLEREARAEKVDISTEKGRKALKSLVFRVARSKTALDDMGKALGADARKTIDRINADRRIAWGRLEGLGASIRKPLTDWENADKARIAAHEAAIQAIHGDPLYLDQPHTSVELRERLDALRAWPARDWQEFATVAADALAGEISDTETALEQTIAFEAAHAERVRAQAETAARAQAERDAQIKAQAEAAAAEAIAAAERRAAQAEQDRIDTQIAAAEEAEAGRARAEQEAARAVAAAQARRAAQDAAEAAAQVARAADMAHRRTINGEALDDLRAAGLTVEVAQAVITAIAQGKVRHVAIRY